MTSKPLLQLWYARLDTENNFMKMNLIKTSEEQSENSSDMSLDIIEATEEAERLGVEIIEKRSDRTFNEVFGLSTAKQMLIESIILPIKYNLLFKTVPHSFVLMFGAPGTGKSFLAKSIANYLPEGKVIYVHCWNFLSKYMSEAEKNMRQIFQFAKRQQPCLLVMEDIDCLATSRYNHSSDSIRRLKTEFMVQFYELNANRRQTVVILGITHWPKETANGLSRLCSKRIYTPLPDEYARKDLLKDRMSSCPHSLTNDNFDDFSTRTEGYTGSDLEALVKHVLMVPLRDMMNSTHFFLRADSKYEPCSPSKAGASELSLYSLNADQCYIRPITWEDVTASLSRNKPSINQDELQNYVDYLIQKDITDQLYSSPYQPNSLFMWAKISIISCLGKRVEATVNQLPLPKKLRRYLLL